MLKDGLLRSMTHTPLSKITVTDLCKEAGINRATFYNHYDSPLMVLKEIAYDYATQLREISQTARLSQPHSERAPIEACFEYMYSKKEEIRILFSENAENSISGFSLDIITENVKKKSDKLAEGMPEPSGDAYLRAIITASATLGLIRIWLTTDINKSPAEIVDLLIDTFGGRFFR